MKNILVTGSQGLVGSRFVELYDNKKDLLTPNIEEFDFLNTSLMNRYIADKKIDLVVNFAAYTDVEEAEKERDNKKGLCWKVNVTGVENLVKLFDPNKVHFIHISTDMVFPGSVDNPGPYGEDHILTEDADKLSWYGYTKGEGERIVKDYFENYSILRIIYPVRAKYEMKLDYLRKPLKLYNEGKLYPLFNDQQISISFIDQICEVLKYLIDDKNTGVFHCASSDTTTPYEIINYLIETKYNVKGPVKGISIHNFLKNVQNSQRYPIYGGLKSEITQKYTGIKFLSCREIVDKLIQQGIQ